MHISEISRYRFDIHAIFFIDLNHEALNECYKLWKFTATYFMDFKDCVKFLEKYEIRTKDIYLEH